MLTYYDYYYKELDWELQQVKEVGDKIVSDKNKTLPFEQGKRAVNECIKELVHKNKDRYKQEWTYTFDSDMSTFTVPNYVHSILSWYDSENDVWKMLSDSSDMNSTIISRSHDTIYNSDGWDKGDEIKFKIIKYPDEIRYNTTSGDGVGDYDIVDFPDGHRRLLTLCVKQYAYGRKNKAMDPMDMSKMNELMGLWMRDTGKVKKKTYISYTAHNFGRSRG